MLNLLKTLCAMSTLWLAACATSLSSQVETALTNPEQTGIRWGLVVADMDGRELLAIDPDSRFTPASNTKIVTTMAAYHHLDALETDAANPGTRVFIEYGEADALPDLILTGGADALLADTPDCEVQCLSELADQIAARGLTEIRNVVGDDTLFPYERWGPGWSVEDLQFYYGTAISALSVNDNLTWLQIAPGSFYGARAQAEWRDGDAYFTLDNQAITVSEESERRLRVERFPGTRTVRLYGGIPRGSAPLQFRLAVDHPAEIAALRLKRLLEARGIAVAGIDTRHRPLDLQDEAPDDPLAALPAQTKSAVIPRDAIAILPASDLRESLKKISKDSQNLHADLALRRLGLLQGTGSRAHGVAVLEAFLSDAGIPDHGYAIHGGSGMSVYNRISPRAMVQLLAFAAKQSWFDQWLADQPIGGVDGSLERRFKGSPLEGKVFAKTGTLNGANALSGVMVAKSGRKLLFSIIANDRPASTPSAISEMDAALNLIAAAY